MPRPYHSPAREAQAEATRLRILDAAVDLLGGEATGLDVASVARAAGVSVPTVYRYFPDREALLDGVQARVGERFGRGPPPRSLAEIPARTAERMAWYERNEAVVRAAIAVPGMLAALQRHREGPATAALAPATAHLPPADARAVQALLVQLGDARTWAVLKDEWGAEPDAIGRAAGWALAALLERLHQDGGKEP